MSYFVLQIWRRWVEKIYLFTLWIFKTSKPNWSKNSYYKCCQKNFLTERTLKLAKSRKAKKIWTKVCNLRKTSKSLVSCRKCDIWWLSYLVCVSSFKSISSSSLSRKIYDEGNFNPTPIQWLRAQKISVGIGLIKLTEHFATLNDKPLFRHSILQTISHVFLLFIFL